MKLKSILIFILIIILLAMVLPLLAFVWQLVLEDCSFDNTWIGQLVEKM